MDYFMNGGLGLVTFFASVFLASMVCLQVLSMIQADRLHKRLNCLLEAQNSAEPMRQSQQRANTSNRRRLVFEKGFKL
jgi:hypothetical protein